jgi:chemotaxis-related protein WspD
MVKGGREKPRQDCWRHIGVWGMQTPRCERLAQVLHCRNCQVFVEAGRSVFERRQPAGYRGHWTKALLNPPQQESRPTTGVIVFRVKNEWFSLPARIFAEISAHRSLHRIPHVKNPMVAGVANIGGEVIVCYSLAELLGAARHSTHNNGKDGKTFKRLLVVYLNERKYVFNVDEVKGMARLDSTTLSSPPDTLNEMAKKIVLGVFDFESCAVTVLNELALIELIEGQY